MTATAWLAASRALVELWRNDATITAIDSCAVFSGPPINRDRLFTAVFVGWNGDESEDDAGDISQQPHDLGGGYRLDDNVGIWVSVFGFSGTSSEDGTEEAQDRAFAVLDAMQTALRQVQRLNDLSIAESAAYFENAQVMQGQTKGGVYCRLSFRVAVESVI